MPIVKTVTFIVKKIERFLVYRVLSINDSPHRIALGVAIGIFVTWTPTMGLQMMLTVALCFLLRANKFVGVPFVWISNPLTIVPIYGPNYFVGCRILDHPATDAWKTLHRASTAATDGWLDRIGTWFDAIKPIFLELWVGSIVVGLVLGIITYFVVYSMVIIYRAKLKAFHEHHLRKHSDDPSNDASGNKVLSNDEK